MKSNPEKQLKLPPPQFIFSLNKQVGCDTKYHCFKQKYSTCFEVRQFNQTSIGFTKQ
jgi:hypothetical protein